jgi:hypothetical protein
MSILTRNDSSEISSVIIDILGRYGLLEQGAVKARKLFHVSKAGNIVFADKLLLSAKQLSDLGIKTKNEVKNLLSYLKKSTAEEIIEYIRLVPNHPIRELTSDDFDFEREITDDEKSLLIAKFNKVHQKYVNDLKKDIDRLFTGLDVGFETLLPAGVLNRLKCNAESISCSFDKKKIRFLMKCSCGIEAEAYGIFQCQVLNKKEDDFQLVQAKVIDYYFNTYEKFQLSVKVKSCFDQAEQINEAYFIDCNACPKLKELKNLKTVLEKQRSIRFSTKSGLWEFGFMQLPDIAAETICKAAHDALNYIQNGRLFLREGIEERLKKTWEAVGKKVYEEAEKMWYELSCLDKLRYPIASAHEKLVSFANACSNGEVKLSQNKELLVGGVTVDTDNEEKFIAETVKLLADGFQCAVNLTTAVNYNEYIAYQVLCTIGAYSGKMGVTTAAALLTGSNAQKIIANKYNRSSYYGTLKGRITQKDLCDLIKNMVQDGLLNIKYVGWHDMPVLYIPEAVKRQLDAMPPLEDVPDKEKRVVYTVEEAVNKRAWAELAEMAKEDWPAEAALRVAAVLWPSGKAAKAAKAAFTEK